MNETATRGLDILLAIDPVIRVIHDEHVKKQKLWMPTELLPEHFEAQKLPPELTAMLILNLLTEDGLPYFFGLLVHHLGTENAIWDWSRMWTAEEDRHGRAIQKYLDRVLTRKEAIAVEHMQYAYLKQGFWPEWERDPIKLLAYVVLQEQATKVSYLGIAKAANDHDPALKVLMRKIAAEESKHHMAYFGMFEAAFEQDPSHALAALQWIIKKFSMPGKSIPGFATLSEVHARCDVFGLTQFADLVTEIVDKLELGKTDGLTIEGEQARDSVMASQEALCRFAERSFGEKRSFTILGFDENFVITV
jgi:acyl-[acyl-carrier-protein] desaturase